MSGLSSSILRRISQISASPIPSKAIQLFKITNKERVRLAKLELEFQPTTRSRTSLPTPLAKKLGFNPKILDSLNSG